MVDIDKDNEYHTQDINHCFLAAVPPSSIVVAVVADAEEETSDDLRFHCQLLLNVDYHPLC